MKKLFAIGFLAILFASCEKTDEANQELPQQQSDDKDPDLMISWQMHYEVYDVQTNDPDTTFMLQVPCEQATEWDHARFFHVSDEKVIRQFCFRATSKELEYSVWSTEGDSLFIESVLLGDPHRYRYQIIGDSLFLTEDVYNDGEYITTLHASFSKL